MKKLNIKYFALVSIPILMVALVIALTVVIAPQMQIASAMEVVANDPQIRDVIEEYKLEVHGIEIKDNIAYIFLNKEGSLEVTITVDLEKGTVGKIVTKNEKILYNIEDVEEYNDAFEEKAASMGMTIEEFKKYLIKQGKGKHEIFAKKAEAMNMTIEEFKKYLVEQYEEKAASMGMSVEEFKKYMVEQKKAKFEEKAASMGMSVEELKAYFTRLKK